MRKRLVTVLTLLFCLTSMIVGPVSPASAETWTQIITANTPENNLRGGIARHTNGYYIYLVGGISNTGARYSKAVTLYDTRTKEYTKLGDLLVGLERTHVIYYNNALYIIGGTFSDGTTYGGKNTTVYKFDLSTNVCTALGNAPRTPGYSGMALQGTTAYFYGGYAVEGLMKYDLTSDTWTELGSGPRGLDQLWYPTGFATSDGKVHFYGGRHSPSATYYNDVVTYDPQSGFSTSQIPAYGSPKYLAKGVVTGSKLIVTGGYNETQAFSEVISFDYTTKSWVTETSLPHPTNNHMVAANNGNVLVFESGTLFWNSFVESVPGSWSLVETTNQATNFKYYGFAKDSNYFYLVGGQDRFGGTYLRDVHRYDPASKTFTRLADLPVGLDRGMTALVKNGYLYVFGGVKPGTQVNYNVFRLSLTENTWEDLGPVTPFFFASGIVIQGEYAYAFGGSNSGEAMLKYDFDANAWTNLGNNPRGLTTIYQPSGFMTPDGRLHFYAGGTGPTANSTFFNDVVTFDPDDNSFSMSEIPAYGTPKRQARSCQLGSKIYFVGGLVGTDGIAEVVSYDTSSGLWATETPLPAPGHAGSTVFGNSIVAYVEGQVYQFTPGPAGGSGNSMLQATITGQSAAYFSPSVINPSQVTLNGSDGLKATYTTSPWRVTDGRGTGAGWYATMSATVPTNTNGRTIGLENLKLNVSSVGKDAEAQTSSNPAMLQSASGVTLDQARTVIASPVNQGMGSFVFTPGLEMSIPAGSFAGEYSSTISSSFYESAPVI